MSDIRVLPRIRIVANGRSGDTCKATLLLTPCEIKQQPGQPERGIPLQEWPQRASAWLAAHLAPADGKPSALIQWQSNVDGTAVDAERWNTIPRMEHRLDQVRDWSPVAALWQSLFEAADKATPWTALAAALKQSASCKPGSEVKLDAPERYAPPLKQDQFDVDGALLVDRTRLASDVRITGVIPMRQGDLALVEERERAMRILRKINGGPAAVDDRTALEREPAQASSADTPGVSRQQYWDNVREELLLEFQATVQSLKSERDLTKKVFANSCSLLSALEISPTQCLRRVGEAEPLASESVEQRRQRRKGYVLTSWLQRDSSLKCGVTDDTMKRPEVNDEALRKHFENSKAAQKAASIYFMLQGDALLSRLFCLSVDISFKVPDGTGDGYLFLKAEAPGERPDGFEICSAAKLSDDAFWPHSVFDRGLIDGCGTSRVSHKALAEQSDGMWHLGATIPCEDAKRTIFRYGLSSLDVRRAVDTKHDSEDRGERHSTAGITLLDRGRADQIVHQMAIAAQHDAELCKESDQPKRIFLYAENLTTGRRVDVACVSPGKKLTDKKDLPLKNVMRRWVDFGLRPEHRGALDVLTTLVPPPFPRKPCFYDDGAFQVAARQVPLPDTNASSNVAIAADEAIFLWDGQPPVLQGKPELCGDEAAGNLALPIAVNRHLRSNTDGAGPPPLRYGASYALSLRSVFIGGGSVSDDEAKRFHLRTKGEHLLPPADNCRVRTLCFRRHEGISAPTLLLPVHLATTQYKAMGYEQLDQAIVRSGRDAELGTQVPPPPRQQPYIGLDRRTLPETTTRVFVAPEASLEDVRRHGMLDGADWAEVVQGGLQGVGFIRTEAALRTNRRNTCDTPSVATDQPIAPDADGFPFVVTDTHTGFDGQAIYRRRLMEQGNESGAAVFAPGGRHRVPKDRHGWLPDPAVWRFSVRARLRGSERYLDGSLDAELYGDGKRYPHALPLVLHVQKKCGLRSTGAAKSIADLTSGSITKAPLAWFGVAGRGGGRHAVRVRELVLELYEGEDYDLEVVCLPDAETLAATFSLPETIAIQQHAASIDEEARQQLNDRCGDVDLSLCAEAKLQFSCGIGGCAVPEQDAVVRVANSMLKAITQRWPVEEIAAVTRLRVCHAVNRPQPAAAPRLCDLAVRRAAPPQRADFANPPGPDRPGETSFLLQGQLQLDLEQIDAFELIAETVATSGAPLDDASRRRSSLSRRSGRWPTRTNDQGGAALVEPRHVYGFDVDRRGRVKLPREEVRLLRVDNLPLAGAVDGNYAATPQPPAAAGETDAPTPAPAAVADASKGVAGNLLGATVERVTQLDLGQLFAAGSAGATIELRLALPDQAKPGVVPRTHLVKVAQPHKLADTRARKLCLSVRALSRFAGLFETAPVYDEKNREVLLRRRQALNAADQSIVSELTPVWIPATERPPPCKAQSWPSITENYSTQRDCDGTTVFVYHRIPLTKVEIERGQLSSGEGERIGLVLWPPNYFNGNHDFHKDTIELPERRVKLSTFVDSDLGPGGAFITRWGGDPIRGDQRPQEKVFIPPSAFGDAEGFPGPRCWDSPHDPRTVCEAQMPVTAEEPRRIDNAASSAAPADPAAPAMLPVTLLTYEPCFDLDSEKWFVTIDLRPFRPSEPIVRLGLVRYQEHAIGDLQVSPPTVVSLPLLPERRCEVHFNETGSKVDIRVKGPGSADIKNLQPAQMLAGIDGVDAKKRAQLVREFDRIRRPLMRVSLHHETLDCQGKRLRQLDLRSQAVEGERAVLHYIVPELLDDELFWHCTLTLPPDFQAWGRGRLVAHVEEIERRMPASYANEPIDVPEMLSRYVESGPRMIADIAFHEISRDLVYPTMPFAIELELDAYEQP